MMDYFDPSGKLIDFPPYDDIAPEKKPHGRMSFLVVISDASQNGKTVKIVHDETQEVFYAQFMSSLLASDRLFLKKAWFSSIPIGNYTVTLIGEEGERKITVFPIKTEMEWL